MTEPFDALWARYRADPDAFAQSSDAPVLVLELPERDPMKTSATYQLHTIPKSGYQPPRVAASSLVSTVMPSRPGAARITVGRTPNNDVVLEHPSISRLHAWFEWHKGTRGWQVADAGSRNGTVVNAQRLSSHQLKSLGDQSVIGFGDVNVLFLYSEALIRFLERFREE